MSDIYDALADPTRRAVLDELVERDGQTLFELCTRLLEHHGIGSSRQAVSQHLAVLEDAGLVSSERVGRTRVVRVDLTPLDEIPRRWPTDRTDDP